METIYKFDIKRNYKLTTPCCVRTNNDGKFVNYKGLSDNYGYCHSCGKTSLPPTVYENTKGEKYVWDEVNSEFKINDNISHLIISEIARREEPEVNYIPDSVVFESVDRVSESNLLNYIRKTYGEDKTEDMIDWYLVGTTAKGEMQFWYIDINRRARKDKVIEYNLDGKRTSNISSTYLNEQGYKSCLFGEHLLSLSTKPKVVVLVESEKTAIILFILLPKYTWLAYGGINGLTKSKMKVLKGFKVLVVPDMSENAVSIINKKVYEMQSLKIDATIWDITDGRTDEQLKIDGVYNNDLEDVIKKY